MPAADIREISRRIAQKVHPHRIILFGSRARGQGHKGSDWDILVIADSKAPRYRRAAPLYGMLRDMPAQVDIIIYTPKEIEEWKDVPQALVTTAIREGKVLYEES